MKLSDYFEKAEGVGVLATADASGMVDAAIYGRPHFFDEQTVAFIASEKLTHANLQSNPHACYLFKEKSGYEGRRLYLTRIREEKDSPLIDDIRKKKHPEGERKYKTGTKYLIYFRLDKVLPLVGAGS
jgi:hypothetical protein